MPGQTDKEALETPVINSQDDKTDSLEWGSGAKDCKAKFYCNIAKEDCEYIKLLIDKANLLRAYAVKVSNAGVTENNERD